ncbi:MAG: dihydroorotate dehydrogenase catalytic subunit [Gaiellaceae bacterium MAG52_C11]|nr:dihydroorotate dehydrogenase catalytic subunit [Candidatus Gaiellasilicea maunaloa]
MLLNASGCLDALSAPEVARSLDGYVTKTITPEPREGNPPVRIAETRAGMLNSIGLANPGRERFLAQTLPRLRDLELPIWVSVGGFSVGEYAETCAALDGEDGIAAIELNLSCPNVDEAPEGAIEIVAACREATDLPLYAKLSPATWNMAEHARAVEFAGADGLSLVNTLRGLALDRNLRPTLGTGGGGYSGPALKPVALAAVYACANAVELPIVGMGGVRTGLDALELIAAGASSVALGTLLFTEPEAPARIRVELAAEAAARNLAHPLAARRMALGSSPESVVRIGNEFRK